MMLDIKLSVNVNFYVLSIVDWYSYVEDNLFVVSEIESVYIFEFGSFNIDRW